jgi:hypothetical protein
VIIGDGAVVGDNALQADAALQAQSATANGEETPSMELEVDSGVDYLGY